MGMSEKMRRAAENTWLNDALSPEERATAQSLAEIAASIQRQRLAKGYTQAALAEKLGVSQAMVSRWENGEENFTITTLSKISGALGMEFRNPLAETRAV
jgi:ribosome-binding protein aMBF1 (putative translation factor)